MAYFNYHATAKRLIRQGRLREYRILSEYRGIRPALLLFFEDERHPVMPIREAHFDEYFALLKEKTKEN